MFEPQGDVEKWVNRFNAAHEKTFSESDSWDAFMSLGMGYYTPYLKDHLVRWVANDLPHRAHTYKNTVDGVTMYMISTYNPNTGNVLEIHSMGISDDAEENAEMEAKHFTATPASACMLALCTGLSTEHMQKSWEDESENRHYSTFHGLPYSNVAKISHPSMSADTAAAWMVDNAQLPFTVKDSDNGDCRIAHANIKKYKDTSYVNVMFVEDTRNNAAEDDDVKERAQFLNHVQAIHDKRLGTQRGWDRWLDNHLGLMYQVRLSSSQPRSLHRCLLPHTPHLASGWRARSLSNFARPRSPATTGRPPRRHRAHPRAERRRFQGLPRRIQDGFHLQGKPQRGLLRVPLDGGARRPGHRVPQLL